jgi:cysteinyl-tRNA synthetase
LAIAEMHRLAERARKDDMSAAEALHQSIKFLLTDAPLSRRNLTAIGEGAGQLLPAEFRHDIDTKVAARNAARKAKNFGEADRIRDELAAMGIVLKDSKDGTTWEIAR